MAPIPSSSSTGERAQKTPAVQQPPELGMTWSLPTCRGSLPSMSGSGLGESLRGQSKWVLWARGVEGLGLDVLVGGDCLSAVFFLV